MYKVLAALHGDVSEGHIWSTNKFSHRAIVKIKNKDTGKLIYCENLYIDESFLNIYNPPPIINNSPQRRIKIEPSENTIIMSEWYRERLGGIETQTNHSIELTEANNLWGKYQASKSHPQVVVRLATSLSVFGVGLGAIGLFLGLLPLVVG